MSGARTVHGLIPVRIGSRRVKAKNLRLVNGRPLMAHAIDAVKGAFQHVARAAHHVVGNVVAAGRDRDPEKQAVDHCFWTGFTYSVTQT